MSTAFAERDLTGDPDEEPVLAPGSVGHADAAARTLAGNLALSTAAFADTFERYAHRRAVEAGASIPRLRLLYFIHCNGPQKMADLAGALRVTPRNVTALVDGLEAERMVRRVPHSTDRRVTLVELTCNSDRVAAQFGAYQASIVSLFDGIGEADGQTLLRLLDALQDRMHAGAGCSIANGDDRDA